MRAVLILLLLCATALAGPKSNSFILLMPDGNTTTMSGNVKDIERVAKLHQPHERLLWARVDGREYIVRDPATLDQFEAIWKPVNQLGDAVGKLGEQEGKLGEQQGKLGAKQGALGAREGALGAELPGASKQRRKEIEREMRELDKQMKDLDDQMATFDAPMRDIEKQMRPLEKQLDAAGKKADAASNQLLAKAIGSGVAKPL